MTRRTLLTVAAAISGLAGLAVASVYIQVKAAGDLAATLVWANKHSCFGTRFDPGGHGLRRKAIQFAEGLEGYEAWWREAYTAGLVGSLQRLQATREAVGPVKACDMHIRPYGARIDSGWIWAGVWGFPVPSVVRHEPKLPADFERIIAEEGAKFTDRRLNEAEDRWRGHSPEPAAAPASDRPPSSPSVASTTKLLPLPTTNECTHASADGMAGKITVEEAHARCDASLEQRENQDKPLPGAGTPTIPLSQITGLRALVFKHGVARRRLGHAVAPFRITAASGSNYFFKLVRRYTNEEEMVGFIVGGMPLETKVPEGNYELRYAAGDTWINELDYFGPSTGFAKADSPLNFAVEDGRARGVEVQLVLRRVGNLKTRVIDRTEF